MTELVLVGVWMGGMLGMHLLLSWEERRKWPEGRPIDHPGHTMLATLWPLTGLLLLVSVAIWATAKARGRAQ